LGSCGINSQRQPEYFGDTIKRWSAAAEKQTVTHPNIDRTFHVEIQQKSGDDAASFRHAHLEGRASRVIVVFGSITVDLITPVTALPHVGETVIGGDYTIIPGGKGANQALAAALGAGPGQSVAMIGTIGADAWGALALEHLRKAGIDLTLVGTGERRTACGFISVDTNGQTLITVSPGANMETRADAIARLHTPLGPNDWLMLQMEVPLEENWRALKAAKAAGARTVLNLAPAMPIDDAVLADLDILIVNQPEAQFIGSRLGLASNDPLDIARTLAKGFALTCIATLGEEGSLAVEPTGQAWRIGRPNVTVIDTTGAGDAYTGTLIAALDRGAPLPEAMRFASTGASLACESRGAQTAYRRHDEIERQMIALAPASTLDTND
jgi:ribokinase